jgi:hypothetical protein
MRNFARPLATLSLVAAAGFGGAALAADAAAPAAPTGPSLADVLTASGITATGYVDGTFDTLSYSGTGSPADYNTFTFQQAALTLAYQPKTGFGALVNVIAGQSPYSPNYSLYTPVSGTGTSFYVLQGYAQYATGPLTLMVGKFTTLAGAEVVAPNGNTNVTRSLLFAYEPVTHTGVRAAIAASDTVTVTLGVNNGWFYDGAGASNTSSKTGELGVTFTPSKAFTLAAVGYYGRDCAYGLASECGSRTTVGTASLLDVVATYNVSDALSLVGSIDYGTFKPSLGTSANWTGYAAYVNYNINDMWRFSLRGEYFDDHDGFETGTPKTKLDEGTLTFAFMPDKHFEFRIEGRYDDYKYGGSGAPESKVTGGWLEALYKF